MWEEEEKKCTREREITPPDSIMDGTASWGDIPNENQPPRPQHSPRQDQTTPTTRHALADITSQFAQPLPPSLSGVDLTAHLMSLVERLEPARGAPRRRRQTARSCETQQPPHRTVRSSSFSSPKTPGARLTHTQPASLRNESISQIVLRPSAAQLRGEAQNTVQRALGCSAPRIPQGSRSRRAESTGAWSGTCFGILWNARSSTDSAAFKQPSRVNSTPPPKPSEVDIRHAELAEKFASFAAYIKQHEERAPPLPVLGTRVRTLSLPSTKSLGHLDSHMLGKHSQHAVTQGPGR